MGQLVAVASRGRHVTCNVIVIVQAEPWQHVMPGQHSLYKLC